MAEQKKHLVIVESPSKAKTIEKYLGSRYKVVASKGHVRDLPKSKLGVDIEHDFEPQYINIRGKAADIKMLKEAAAAADVVYLATDPDREGEAISWHLATLLQLEPEKTNRIEFHEITKSAVTEAIKHPRTIDQSLVDAQQARRVLDRIVGYEMSPILWHKVRRGLSAGRVQSAALKILCDRENKISAFIPEEYWNLAVTLSSGKSVFTAKLTEKNGKKCTITNGTDAEEAEKALRNGSYRVASVEEKERAKKPFPPYNTSSLQQDASIRLNMTGKRTMGIAQQLYENGLITYMRTDSYRIAPEARKACEAYVEATYGKEYVGNNVYGNKKGNVQDAHEAIRPTDPSRTPQQLKSADRDTIRLYTLIWSRFLASCMKAAIFDDTTAQITCGAYGLRAHGSKKRFDGFLKVYDVKEEDEDAKALPPLKQGDQPVLQEVHSEQKFTEPPSRFTEAALIKELEEKGIGRPSTYATILSTLLEHLYVKREKKALIPTELGFQVIKLIEDNFKESKIVDAAFTAQMEEQLDQVEEGTISRWQTTVKNFYDVFHPEIERVDAELEHVEMKAETAKNPDGSDMLCELCGKPMVIKQGRFGSFIACSGYPACKNTKPIVKGTGVMCPSCGKEILVRRSKKGKTFYGCSGYPDCKQVYWYKPVNKTCPKCGALLVEHRLKGSKLSCSNEACDYKE